MPGKTVLFALLLCFSAGISAQTPGANPAPPTTPTEYFNLARQQSELRQDGARPFRLTATFTDRDEKGKTRTGQYSELWVSKDRWKREVTVGDYHEASANIAGVYYQLVSSPRMDFAAARMIDYLSPELPNPTDAETTNKEWSLKSAKVGGIEMIQVTHTKIIKNDGTSLPLSAAFFFTPQSGYIRAVQWPGRAVFYNDVHNSLGRIVPYTVSLKSEDKEFTEIKISEFSDPGTPPDDAFLIPGATKFDASTDAVMSITPKTLHTLQIKNLPPVFPEMSRAMRASGDVEMQVTIGRDGHLRDLKVIQGINPNFDFVDSATTKVRNDTFRPFLLNGVPTSVTGIITIHYRSAP